MREGEKVRKSATERLVVRCKLRVMDRDQKRDGEDCQLCSH